MSTANVVLSERLAHATAYLISLYSLDVLVTVIDIFSLPLPRYVASMSFSLGFMLASLGILIPMARMCRIPLLGRAFLALAGMLTFWAGLEVIGMAGRGYPRFDLIFEFGPLLLVLVAVRLHLRLFVSSRILVNVLVLTMSGLVLIHTMLLLIASLDIPMSFVNLSELRGRNSMALLVPVSLWLLAFFPLEDWPVFGFRYNLLLLLALANTLLASARTAFLILLWCVLAAIVLRSPRLRRWMVAVLLPTGLIIVGAVMFSYPILVALSEQGLFLGGQSDDVVSIWSRSQTNALLFDKLKHDPLLGLGWSEVAATKALGYMGHTLYINVLAAYGVIGALAAVVLIVMGLRFSWRGGRGTAAHFLFLVVLIASFSNNVFAYFGIVIALIGAERMSHVRQSS